MGEIHISPTLIVDTNTSKIRGKSRFEIKVEVATCSLAPVCLVAKKVLVMALR